MKGRVVRTSHQSQCLSDNPLGDPYERDLYVYLPPQYDGTRRFPVVMMLAGFGATNHSIAGWSPWQPNTIEMFDQLDELRRYVQARGWTLVEYVDHGVSGAKETRPALDALVKDATRRKVDVGNHRVVWISWVDVAVGPTRQLFVRPHTAEGSPVERR